MTNSRDIPKEMRAVVLEAHHLEVAKAIGGLKVMQRPVPQPGYGQVLVKIEAAPCNPSDLVLLQGKGTRLKTLPAVPGWEGAGRVVASGGGLLPWWLKGKRVACGVQGDRSGTWAEYVVADATQCIPLKAKVRFPQAAGLIVNPLTAVGLLHIAKREGHRAAISTAAASQLGRMLLTLAADEGFPLISVVRRQQQVELLQSLGASNVLNSTDANFAQQLRKTAKNLNATIAFDAVAGEFTGSLLACLPPKSTVYLYGALSEEACSQINPMDIIYHQKKMFGFYLAAWIKQRGPMGILRDAGRIQRMIISGRIETKIQRRVGLDDIVEGLTHYVQSMTEGKVLIVPGKST